MSENQKLRDALQAIANIDDSTNHSVDASAALDRIGRIARQALALPTADHIPDAGGMVADHLPEAGKMIETAAPVGEREAFENEMRHVDVWGHRSLKKRASGNYENWQVNLMWDVWQARAALSAGDAVDAQRYRLLRTKIYIDPKELILRIRDVFLTSGATLPEMLDAAIDAAMRKGQL